MTEPRPCGSLIPNLQERRDLPCMYPTLELENINCIVSFVLLLFFMVTKGLQSAFDQHCVAVDQVNHGW